MAYGIDISPVAANDIALAYEYILARNPDAAARLVRKIEAAIRKLAEHPFSAPRTELPGRLDLRKLSVPPYVVFYRVLPGRLEIVRVLHSARDVFDSAHFSDP